MKKLLITAMAVLFRFKLRTEESRKTDYRKMVQSLYIQVYG